MAGVGCQMYPGLIPYQHVPLRFLVNDVVGRNMYLLRIRLYGNSFNLPRGAKVILNTSQHQEYHAGL